MSPSVPLLGRLKRVGLRTVWLSEADDFTPWLAREENIANHGLDLEVEAREHAIVPFRAALLCRDTTTANWVLVENQLEKTDHTHLVQLMMHAAGLHAATNVWIAERFAEEHRAARPRMCLSSRRTTPQGSPPSDRHATTTLPA